MSSVRSVCAAVAAAATLALAGVPAASAAPYADEPEVETANPNPPVGGDLKVELSGFGGSEAVDLELRSDPIFLAQVVTDAGGEASTVVALPDGLRCAHRLVATGKTSGIVASTQIFIGSRRACAEGDGGNVGSGNTGSGNIGSDNTGSGNIGDDNTGDGNIGSGNDADGTTAWGKTSSTSSLRDDSPTEVLAILLLGMAVTGGVGFLCTRRRHDG